MKYIVTYNNLTYILNFNKLRIQIIYQGKTKFQLHPYIILSCIFYLPSLQDCYISTIYKYHCTIKLFIDKIGAVIVE